MGILVVVGDENCSEDHHGAIDPEIRQGDMAIS